MKLHQFNFSKLNQSIMLGEVHEINKIWVKQKFDSVNNF